MNSGAHRILIHTVVMIAADLSDRNFGAMPLFSLK